MHSRKYRPLSERFHEKYERIPFLGCWLWTGSTMAKGGYGKLSTDRGGKVATGAHRISWLLHKGQIPDGLWVLHRCDVPLCVNPDHLFLGTAKDNAADCVAKGRRAEVVQTFVGPPCPRRIRQANRRLAKYGVRERPMQAGEKNWNAKLDAAAVADIRTKRMRKADFARLYRVSFKAVKNIWDGVSWQELPSTGV